MEAKPLLSASQKKILFALPRAIFKWWPAEKILCQLMNSGFAQKFWKQCVPPASSYKNPTWRPAIRKGIAYQFNLSEQVDWYNYFNFSQVGFQRFLNLLPANATVLDVGANIGTTTLPIAKKCGQGTVFAFEPFAKNYQRLQDHLSQNKINNVVAVPMACSDKNGTAFLEEVALHNSGMNRISATEMKNGNEISTCTIDDFLHKIAVQKVEAIKIDTEGHEQQVIQGALNTITQQLPILFIELDDEHLINYNSSAPKLLTLLKDLGYNDITEAATGIDLNKYGPLTKCHLDIICQASKIK